LLPNVSQRFLYVSPWYVAGSTSFENLCQDLINQRFLSSGELYLNVLVAVIVIGATKTITASKPGVVANVSPSFMTDIRSVTPYPLKLYRCDRLTTIAYPLHRLPPFSNEAESERVIAWQRQ
jgi:hypothetical protein